MKKGGYILLQVAPTDKADRAELRMKRAKVANVLMSVLKRGGKTEDHKEVGQVTGKKTRRMWKGTEKGQRVRI